MEVAAVEVELEAIENKAEAAKWSGCVSGTGVATVVRVVGILCMGCSSWLAVISRRSICTAAN